jgi:predicted nucleic acid-binding protein
VNARQGITFDTGALIALERKDKRMREVCVRARDRRVTITVPAVVLIEWWRGARGQLQLMAPLVVEPTSQRIAKVAGEALTTVKASAVDAAVMASAALRGDLVYTSDLEDLQRLQACFPSVRVLRATA